MTMKEKTWRKRYLELKQRWAELLNDSHELAEENEQLLKKLAALEPQPEFEGPKVTVEEKKND